MALSARKQLQYWGLAAALLLAALYLLGDILLPFVIGGAVAYILDPVADWLERRGLSRAAAVTVITLLAVLGLAVVVLLVIPNLLRQATLLGQRAPDLLTGFEHRLGAILAAVPWLDLEVEGSLAGIGEVVRERGGQLLGGLVVSARSLVGLFFFFLIVPVVAFYMLLDWDRMVAAVDGLLPREHAATIRGLVREVDDTLSGFLRGQATVMVIVAVYYAGALMLAGLNFALVVGFLAGIVSFIPYVGAIVGGGLAMGLALFQFWGSVEVAGPEGVTMATDWSRIAIVAAIFVSGQVLEGNILTPKLVGSSVGLHPVWLLLALSAFGAAFGFVGLLAAVPLAAVLGVLVRFGIGRYRTSKLYRGTRGEVPAAEPTAPPVGPAPMDETPVGATAARRAAGATAGAPVDPAPARPRPEPAPTTPTAAPTASPAAARGAAR